MPFDFISPGAAASDALTKFMIQQQALNRQRMLDQITAEREQRLAAKDVADTELARENAKSLASQRESEAQTRATQRANTIASNMPVGQAVDADTAAALKAGGLGSTVQDETKKTLPFLSLATAAQAPSVGVDANSVVKPPTPSSAAPTAAPGIEATVHGAEDTGEKTGVTKYIGTDKQQQAERARQAVIDMAQDPAVASHPGAAALIKYAGESGDYQGVAGALSKMFEDKQPKTPHHYVVDPRTNKMVDLGEVPDGSTFTSVPSSLEGGAGSGTYVPFVAPDGSVYLRNNKNAQEPMIPLNLPNGQTARSVTAQTRAVSEGASMLQPHIDAIKQEAADLNKAGLFGPMMSRIRSLAAKAGSVDDFMSIVNADPQLQNDERVGHFATSLGLLATGAARVHGGSRGGGSPQMLAHFKELLGDAGTLNMFNGRMDALDDYMGGYAAGPHPQDAKPSPGASSTPPNSAEDAAARKARIMKAHGL